MAFLRSVAEKAATAGELLVFLWERKLWWLVPLVFLLLVFGMVMIFPQWGPLAPFIYTLF